jgi:tetratricopeptide (TPR) repeat protein
MQAKAVHPTETMKEPPIATAASSSTPREMRAMFLMVAALLLVGIVAYYNTFSAPFLFDDDPSIADNPSIRKLWPPGDALSPPATGASVTSRPIINLSFAINYALGGLDVRGYHAVNLAVHLCAALALFGIVRRTLRQPLLRPRFGDQARPIAFLAALWWMLHPMQTESVTWVVQRTESLMGLFYLLTLYAAIRAMESPRPSRWQILAFVACLAGMASKEVMVSAPLIVLLYDRTFVAGAFRAAWERRKWSYVSLGATWVLLAWLVFGMGGGNRGGTSSFTSEITWWRYLCTQAEGIVRYLKLSFWPHPLVLDYGTYIARNPAVIAACFLFLASLGVATVVALWRRPVWGFVGVWFFAILAPSSSVLPLATQTLAEHRMYLPLAAVLTLGVVGLYGLGGRRGLFVAAVLAVILGGLTIRRNADYRSGIAIWTDTVAKRPDNARAQAGLGGVLLLAGRAAEAIPFYEQALRLDPKLSGYSLGNALLQAGRAAEAIPFFEQALRRNPKLTDFVLGYALLKAGRTAEAIPIYERTVRLNPDRADVCNDLANALADVGRVPEAIGYYERALRINPGFSEAHNGLGAVLYASGRMPEAIEHYQQALQGRPDYPEAAYNLGLALLDTGRLDEAVAAFRTVVQRSPGLASAWCSLGRALERSARTAEAAASFEEALRRAPDSAEARDGLARVRAAPR